MATGDVKTSLVTVGTATWFDFDDLVAAGDTVVAFATHRTSAQSTVDPVSVGTVDIPTVHKGEDQIGNLNARRAVYVCARVLTAGDITTIGENPALAVNFDGATSRTATAYLIEGEFDPSTLTVDTDSSGTGQANSLTPGPLVPGSNDTLAAAGLVLRHGAAGTVAFSDSYASALQQSTGSANANGLTGASAVKLVSASTSTNLTWTTAEESTAVLVLIEQPSAGGGTVTGVATGTATTAGTATGIVHVVATASSTSTTSATATGVREVQASATGPAATAGSASGSTIIEGTATGAATTGASTSGIVEHPGTAAGSSGSTGAASGLVEVHATVSGSASTAASASGLRDVVGTATGATSTSGSASGTGDNVTTGTASGSASTTGSATGERIVLATATASATTTADGTGVRIVLAISTAPTSTGAQASALVVIEGTATGAASTAGSATGGQPSAIGATVTTVHAVDGRTAHAVDAATTHALAAATTHTLAAATTHALSGRTNHRITAT